MSVPTITETLDNWIDRVTPVPTREELEALWQKWEGIKPDMPSFIQTRIESKFTIVRGFLDSALGSTPGSIRLQFEGSMQAYQHLRHLVNTGALSFPGFRLSVQEVTEEETEA
jgi:hypothetical protein